MPTELLSAGPVYIMVQNQVYALPARAATVHSSAAVEVNTTSGTTGWVTLTGANTIGQKTGAAFIRATGSATTVSLRND